LPATREVGVEGLRFHDLRHTAATLAAASGASLRALMARIGHASAAAAIRYQHVIDGQDSDIVDYLERFDRPPTRRLTDDGRQRSPRSRVERGEADDTGQGDDEWH
jgi:hypothetical protein